MTQVYFHCSNSREVRIDRSGEAVSDLAEAWTEANFCKVRVRRNRSIARSRRRNGKCEFSA